MKKLLNQVTMVTLALMLAFGLIFAGNVPTQAAKKSSKQTIAKKQKKANKAFAKALKNKKIVAPSNKYKGGINLYLMRDVTGDGVKELFVANGDPRGSNGPANIYTYKNGKVKKIYTLNSARLYSPSLKMYVGDYSSSGTGTPYAYFDFYKYNGKKMVKYVRYKATYEYETTKSYDEEYDEWDVSLRLVKSTYQKIRNGKTTTISKKTYQKATDLEWVRMTKTTKKALIKKLNK